MERIEVVYKPMDQIPGGCHKFIKYTTASGDDSAMTICHEGGPARGRARRRIHLLIDYFLPPIAKATDEAGRER